MNPYKCAHKIETEFVTTTTTTTKTTTTTIRSMTAVDKYRIDTLIDQATSYLHAFVKPRTHNHTNRSLFEIYKHFDKVRDVEVDVKNSCACTRKRKPAIVYCGFFK